MKSVRTIMKLNLLVFIGVITVTCTSSGIPLNNKDSLENLILAGKDVYFKDVTFEKDIDFTKFNKNLLSEGVYQVRILSSITFQNCTFKGKVTAYSRENNTTATLASFQSNLSFIGCTFHEDANFRACSVLGRTDFTNTLFLKTASFEESTFLQNAYFRASAYHEEARFQNAVFMQNANFLKAEFDVTASFQQATFHGEAQFSSTKFMGYADFGLIRCWGNMYINYANFADKAIFNSCYYFGQADFVNTRFNYGEMKNCRFWGDTRFTKSTVEDHLYFDNSFFMFGIPDLSSFDQQKLNLNGLISGIK